MLNSQAQRIASFFVASKVVNKEDEEIYAYGLELLLSTIINVLLIIFMSIFLNRFMESLVFTLFFVILRSYIGGYHAASHLKCILTFQLGYLLNMLILSTLTSQSILPIFMLNIIISISVAFVLGPVQHENKPLTGEEYKYFYKKGICIAIGQALMLIVSFFLAPIPKTVVLAASLGMLMASFSACYAKTLKFKKGR